MLIVNHDQLRLAGIASLEEPCTYCAKALTAYPLIMCDDADQTVYHVTCALELASDLPAGRCVYLLQSTNTLFLVVCSHAPNVASARMPCGERAQTEGVSFAVSEHLSD